MSSLDKLPTLQRLAQELGDKVESYDFVGNGIRFVYKKQHAREYPDANSGIEREIERLERFKAVDI